MCMARVCDSMLISLERHSIVCRPILLLPSDQLMVASAVDFWCHRLNHGWPLCALSVLLSNQIVRNVRNVIHRWLPGVSVPRTSDHCQSLFFYRVAWRDEDSACRHRVPLSTVGGLAQLTCRERHCPSPLQSVCCLGCASLIAVINVPSHRSFPSFL